MRGSLSKTETRPHVAAVLQDPESPKPDQIQGQLQRILASPAFHGSRRSQQFLQYVCEKSLAGEGASIKERTLAVEVFGRQPRSDLAEDTIVRVSAREVRKRLTQYYVSAEGAAAELRIDLPPGSYAPEFRYRDAHPDAPAALIQRRTRGRQWLWAIPAAAFLVAAALALPTLTQWAGASRGDELFARFWAPVFHSTDPLLLTVANPIVYHPSARALTMSEGSLPPQDVPVQRPIQVPPEKLNGSDIIPVFNQYVGFGDMVAATEVASMLARHSKQVRVRMSSSVQFVDLRQTQTLLIGAVTNRWTMELQQSWRFQVRRTPAVKTVIVDTMGGAENGRQWGIAANQDGTAQEDYLLLCRIRNSLTGGLMLVSAGLKQFGTEAGGRLLADPAQLGAILRQLPAGWESKNLQVVLHAKVIGNAPAQPEMVAWHLW